jgi:hypothetical protein
LFFKQFDFKFKPFDFTFELPIVSMNFIALVFELIILQAFASKVMPVGPLIKAVFLFLLFLFKAVIDLVFLDFIFIFVEPLIISLF